jgi:lysophospholipase L1-like esterase
MSNIIRSPLRPVARSVARSVIGPRFGGGGLPDPTTVAFTSAQVATGFAGSISTTKNAARIYGRSNRTIWCGIITGTDAVLTATSEAGSLAGAVVVAVDGGAFVNASNVGNQYTLFAGLPAVPHFVEFRYGGAFGDACYIPSTGNVLSVTGQPPSLASVGDWVQSGAAFNGSARLANELTFSPPLIAPQNNTYGSNVACVKIRGAFTKITATVANQINRIGVSKNGGPPTVYSVSAESQSPPRAIVIPCDGSDSIYYVWNAGSQRSLGGHFAVAGNAPQLSAGTSYKLDQYGDSITNGGTTPSTPADTETMFVAAKLGMVGVTNGINGLTIAGCKTLLDSVLPLKILTANDVAILAIGRNDISPGIDATDQTDFGLCIDKLLAAGYGKVLCRAILPSPTGSSLWETQNAALESVVTARADPKVIWVPTLTWFPYDGVDSTHPSAAGYVTLSGLAEPAYRAALGL